MIFTQFDHLDKIYPITNKDEQRKFIFKNRQESENFSSSLIKAIYQSNQREISYSGTQLPSSTLQDLSDLKSKLTERGEKLKELEQTAEKMAANAKQLRQNATDLKHKYQ